MCEINLRHFAKAGGRENHKDGLQAFLQFNDGLEEIPMKLWREKNILVV